MKRDFQIPVIDLFAGPGGLGEGFSAYNAPDTHFTIRLSIEKDKVAHNTLTLRSFFRQFGYGNAPDKYYDFIKSGKYNKDNLDELLGKFEQEGIAARKEALCLELGKNYNNIIFRKIRESIADIFENDKPWVLIGGPPCQAYSLIGRARNKAKPEWSLEKDARSELYKDYLKILAKFQPAIFVMENVKGILSAKLNGKKVFNLITQDLKQLGKVHYINVKPLNGRQYTYSLYSFAKKYEPENPFEPSDYLIKTENHGVPQKRHRIIILGVREDYNDCSFDILTHTEQIPLKKTIGDLPSKYGSFSNRRTGLSKFDQKLSCYDQLRSMLTDYFSSINHYDEKTHEIIHEYCDAIKSERNWRRNRVFNPDWFLCDKLDGHFCNHEPRSHMRSDLLRYFFVSCFGIANGKSPKLADFPEELLPAHKNADSDVFVDRFKVQLADLPSSTVTCHISKDGHYYIHPDPSQCRSLTVREAARLQTFPDDYFFFGGRTQQYHQVGNAVPPLLARQIAGVVFQIIEKSGRI